MHDIGRPTICRCSNSQVLVAWRLYNCIWSFLKVAPSSSCEGTSGRMKAPARHTDTARPAAQDAVDGQAAFADDDAGAELVGAAGGQLPASATDRGRRGEAAHAEDTATGWRRGRGQRRPHAPTSASLTARGHSELLRIHEQWSRPASPALQAHRRSAIPRCRRRCSCWGRPVTSHLARASRRPVVATQRRTAVGSYWGHAELAIEGAPPSYGRRYRHPANFQTPRTH